MSQCPRGDKEDKRSETLVGESSKMSIAGEKLENARLRTTIMILIMVTTFLVLGPGTAFLLGNITIGNSGSITSTMSLHVEGPLIKDSSGNTVHLRGINKVEWADSEGASWMGVSVRDISSWNPNNVAAELDAMKSWGINVIRCHQAIEQWLYDMGGHKQMLKEFISIAARKGMYVIFDGYSVKNYFNGATQDPLPYPPYQTTPGASTIITSVQDYIDYMVSVASELKSYPNVIFELWNEPQGNDAAKASWLIVAQQCINAIRATGAENLIIVQWAFGCYVNLSFPPPSNPAATMDWVWQANFTDPMGNLVYSTHIYRSDGAFHRSTPTYSNAWTLEDLQLAFQYFRFPELVAEHPLIIGEIGANLAYTGDEYTHELSAFDTCLTLFDQMGIHYAPFWWRGIGVFRLHSGSPSFNANDAGQILKTHLSG